MFVSLSDPCPTPFFDLPLYPSDSSGTERNPFGEFSGAFEAGNVSGAIKNFLAHLLLRQKLHRELPWWEASRSLGLKPRAGDSLSGFKQAL